MYILILFLLTIIFVFIVGACFKGYNNSDNNLEKYINLGVITISIISIIALFISIIYLAFTL